MIVWINDNYYAFAIATIGITFVSMVVTSIINKLNLNHICSFLNFNHTALVQRGFSRRYITVIESEVVPGDIVELKEGIFPFDAIIVSGSCIVNESNINGEPYGVIKTSILPNDDTFNLSRD